MKSSKLISIAVHSYTILGGVIGIFALFATVQNNFQLAIFLLFVTMLIDATDGTLARKYKIWEQTPNFDGAMVDNIIDTLNFAWTPILIMYNLNVLPSPYFLILPVLGTLYAYGQTNMKSDDGFFMAFPTYWSIVALYFYLLPLGQMISSILIVVLSILSFVPTRYLYPTKNGVYRTTTYVLGLFWVVLIFFGLLDPFKYSLFSKLSLIFPIYYMIASFYIEYQVRYRGRTFPTTK